MRFFDFSARNQVYALLVLMSLLSFLTPKAHAATASMQVASTVCFGDSTTAPRGDLDIYCNRLAREFQDVTFINAGRGGDTTKSAKIRFQEDVLSKKPALVIIQFGINDASVNVWKNPPATEPAVSPAEYEANLRYFVETLKASRIPVILMTPNQIRWTDKLREIYGKPPYLADEEKGFTLILEKYADIVRKLANTCDVPLVDIYGLYDEWEKTNKRTCSDLLLDGMHPAAEGHTLVAGALAPLIKKQLGSSLPVDR